MNEKNENDDIGEAIVALGSIVCFMAGVGGVIGYFADSFMLGLGVAMILLGGTFLIAFYFKFKREDS